MADIEKELKEYFKKEKEGKCTDPNKILDEWVKARKKSSDAEEKILKALLKKETISCIPIVAEQLKNIFDMNFDDIVKIAIELEKEAEKEHEIISPEEENALMRGKKLILESSVSVKEVEDKLNDALESMRNVYANRPDMQNLWEKRLYQSRNTLLKKIKER